MGSCWVNFGILVAFAMLALSEGKMTNNSDNIESGESAGADRDDSSERIGAVVTQVGRHPYTAALLRDGSYICSAVILNAEWLLTHSKCFSSGVITSYVTHKHLANYTIRVGSNYNNKGGSTHKVVKLINNFDMKVSAVKLGDPLEFNSTVKAVRLPNEDTEVGLGQLVGMLAWTPTGHIRVVNSAIIDSSICDPYTKLHPGHYICIGGVQDPNRHFCRRDHGGAVIQNNTLIAISAFVNPCAVYTKIHAFPKTASFVHWLDSVIWEDGHRPTSQPSPSTTDQSTNADNATESVNEDHSPVFAESNYMLTLPFEPINVPLEPAEDNVVLPRMSMYESYLKNLQRKKTSTTEDPNGSPMDEKAKQAWIQKINNSVRKMPAPAYAARRHDQTYESIDRRAAGHNQAEDHDRSPKMAELAYTARRRWNGHV